DHALRPQDVVARLRAGLEHEDLERGLPLRASLDGQEHLAHGAATELALEGEATDDVPNLVHAQFPRARTRMDQCAAERVALASAKAPSTRVTRTEPLGRAAGVSGV